MGTAKLVDELKTVPPPRKRHDGYPTRAALLCGNNAELITSFRVRSCKSDILTFIHIGNKILTVTLRSASIFDNYLFYTRANIACKT